MRRATVLATVVLALGALAGPAAMAVAPEDVPDEGAADLSRINGENRFDTAAQTAVRANPDGAETVIVATGMNFPDALAASFFAGGGRDAPIVLAQREHVPFETHDAIEELDPSRIVVLGLTDAISEETFQEFVDTYPDAEVDRIGGATRIETAAELATRGGDIGTAPNLSDPDSDEQLTTAIVARSDDFPDALASGPLALEGRHPILLTPTDALDDTTRDALTDPDLGIEQVIITGGPVAISEDVEAAIADLDNITSVARVDGENRSETAVKLAELTRAALGWEATNISLARADFFPDALTLAPLAVDLNASMYLSQNPQTIGGETFAGIQEICEPVESLTISGGPIAISEDAEGEAKLATICADYTFDISGDQEATDEGGDEDAAGTGWVTIEGDTVCVAYDVEGLEGQANASHIHEGEAGANGDVVQDLGAPDAGGFRATCADNAELAAAITAMPSDYYVNIHTPTYPLGAARGQLASDTELHVYGDAEVDTTDEANPVFEQGEPGLIGDAALYLGEDDTICVDLDMPEGGDVLSGAHIHQGDVDQNGDVVVAFDALVGQTDGFACGTAADAETVAAIIANPTEYYLNVHTDAYPNGIARNQLASELTATLSGDAEVDSEGDPDGTGTARAYQASDTNPDVVCGELHTENLDPLTAAHIHQGAEGVNGDVVVTIGDYGDAGLEAPGADIMHDFGCDTEVEELVAAEIFTAPAGFYVNVHTEAYPAGAIRGQLEATATS